MASGGRLDRAQLAQRAGQYLKDPRFSVARARFCEEVPRAWLRSRLQRRLIADSGAMAVVIAITGLHRLDPAGGASLEVIISALEGSRLASGNRVRAIVAMLKDHGAVDMAPHPTDRRRRRLLPKSVLADVYRAWLGSVLGPLSELEDLAAEPQAIAGEPGLAERYINAIMLRQAVDGFTIMEGWPEALAFMGRRHGYLVMLYLAAHSDCRVDINRSRIAERCGVSQAHVATLLADAERQGWLSRRPNASEVLLAPAFAQRLEEWVARELAIVALWLEAKRPDLLLPAADAPRLSQRQGSARS
ncbi:MAG: hypothetical protein SNJ79_06385 [Sphingomonadaceae bacterium]